MGGAKKKPSQPSQTRQLNALPITDTYKSLQELKQVLDTLKETNILLKDLLEVVRSETRRNLNV